MTPSVELVALADDRVFGQTVPAPPMYFVVVCGASDAALPRLAGLSVFDDGAQSLYRDYQRAQLAEQHLYWDVVDARKIADTRLADLVVATNDLASARKRALELEAELVRTREAAADALARLSDALGATRNRLEFRETWQGWLRWPLGRARKHLGKRMP
jgi:hypothetical protein